MNRLRRLQTQLFDRVNPMVGFSVARYVLSIGIFVGVVLFGYLATRALGVDLLPTPNVPVVFISTQYPGATPAAVDQQVTQVIEGAVSSLSGISSISSSSSAGSSRVVVSFGPDTDQKSAANQVAAQVSAAVRRLPNGVNPPSVQSFDPNAQPILEFSLIGGGASLEEVYEYAQNILVPALQRISGVANVSLTGGPSREFQVLLDPSRLAYYNLTPQQVTQAINSASVDQPIGTLSQGGDALNFATRSVPSSLEQVSQILVDSSRGVRVGDLGSVQEKYSVDNYVRVNQQPAVLVSVQQTSGSNAVAVAEAVRRLIEQTQLPAGYKVTFSNNTTLPIAASVENTYHELLITAVVVGIVVLLFLGRLNTAFTVILAIPISLAAAPILYSLLGFTFNLVSLLAMIVAIGIVVDDSIVVAENVERYREEGLGRMEAVLKGASEVFSAVAAASLSILAVLIPVSFIGGFAGRFIQQFALGLSAAVLMSWLEALLFLTVRMAYTPDAHPLSWRDFGRSVLEVRQAVAWGLASLRKPWAILLGVTLAVVLWRTQPPVYLPALLLYPLALGLAYYLGRALLSFLEALTTTLHGLTEAALTYTREAYARSVERLLAHSPWVLGGALAFFGLTLLLIAPRIPFNFVPQTDSGFINVNLRMPSGTTLSGTNPVAARLEAFLLARPEVVSVQTTVGNTNARLVVQLKPVEERPSVFTLIPQLQRAMQSLIADQPSARVFISGGGGFRGQGTALNFNLASPSYELLNTRINQAIQLLQSDPKVLSVNSDLGQTNPQNNFVPDPSRMAGTGITASSVAQALQTFASGSRAGTVEIGGLSYPLEVRVNPVYLADAQSLLSLPIYSPTLQTNLTVGQLGSIVQSQAPLTISRTNRLYTAQLSINPAPGAPPAAVFEDELHRQLTQAGILDNQVTLSESNAFGQAALSRQLSILGPQVFGLALLLAYLVMGAQFNSFRYPLYLLLPVPFAITGALWFIYFFGRQLDIFSLLGFLLLIGLSAKNAILYLDFVVERMGRMSLKEALVEAAALRFRPIVMTTLTVLVISFPLILGGGAGSEFGQGLGVVMLGGILLSAILTFFVVPATFYLFERGRTGPPHAVPALGGTGD
ncbi:efflux RND transporter permease subunit [Calidithermus roseus]|uniref:Multidrug resistance protein MexB n=1 Tax=Calidithermus roseus TaxID=1644118 RepID=A0A399EQX0_9DEIN|nr:efflux RND transporter permease subunit [Calidithermus roseus]RIH87034.1 Multidrug resistance protein MexB [Calidithermus roseus]